MKKIQVFIFIAFCAVSALSVAEEDKPSVTLKPSDRFDGKSTTANTTTPTTKPTTANTTTPTTKPTTANTTTPTPKPTTANTTTPTTKPTTANTTTTTVKTTTANTTTTTAKPKPTTANTTTTTTKPKPTTANTTTTTAKTTSTPAPPRPTPPTNLTAGNYTLINGKVICLMAQMALQIRVSTSETNGTFTVQPSMTTVEGSCGGTAADLTLKFKEGHISFMFNKSIADNAVYVHALSFALSYPFSKGNNGEYKASNQSLHLFNAKTGHSYSCRNESVYMGSGLYLEVTQDRMQAFNLTKGNEFGSPDNCPADQTDYRVAIAVGVTLLVLIIVVVVAYLLGRKKRTDGYQSL